MAEPEKKLSKNEQKKLAKKAEKAAKKAANKTGGSPAAGGDPAPGGKQAVKATTPVPVEAPAAALKVLLFNGSEGCTATLKTVWAATHYSVDVGVATKKDLPSGFALDKKPALIYGNDVVLGGGGNAMCKAIALMGGAEYSFEADEWCEVERTTMRGKDIGNLESLAAALEASTSGVHIVGQTDSMADICTISTLTKHADKIGSWPASVRRYYEAHIPVLDRVKAAVPSFVPDPPIGLDDPRMIRVLTQIYLDAFESLFPNATVPKTLVSKCSNKKHGDFQCSGAMPAFAALKKTGGLPAGINRPQQVAQAIVAQLGTNHPVLSDLSIQGPGFICCRISSSYLEVQVRKLVGKSLPKPNIKPQQCVVDFSSPNIAKEMHVGHLRSTIIGESVCRVLEFVGHKVERLNHVGDWGTQFGMLIQYLQEEYPDFSTNMPNITDLTEFYKCAKKRFDDDPDFKKTSQLNVGKLQSGNEEFLKMWKILCDISRKEFQKVYNRLDVTTHECGESFYNDKIPVVIEEFDKHGMISIEEGGAKCVFVEGYKVPLMLQKSDKGYGYDSTDMAALKYRLQQIGAHRIIVITDFSQGDHFIMCNRAAHDIGWVNAGQRLQHIGFGTVQGEDGKRFKTRSGDTVRLVDLLDEAVSRMEVSLLERIDSGRANITREEVHDVAEAIGYGAVKYFDLRRNPTSNYKFSYDAMLDTKGDTAVYLLYARVRFESIMAKSKREHGVDVEDLIKNGEKIVLGHDSERNLALQLHAFADMIEVTLDDLFPYHICDYVYNLSIAASEFVTQCRVLGSEEMKSRLLLCHVTTVAMQQCFDLLGIRHIKRI